MELGDRQIECRSTYKAGSMNPMERLYFTRPVHAASVFENSNPASAKTDPLFLRFAMFLVPISEALATIFREVPLIRGGSFALFSLLFGSAALLGLAKETRETSSLRNFIFVLGIYSIVSQIIVSLMGDTSVAKLAITVLTISVLFWVYNAHISQDGFNSLATWYVAGSALASLVSLTFSLEIIAVGGSRSWADVSNEVSSNRNTIAPIYLAALAAIMFLKLDFSRYTKVLIGLVIFLSVITLFSRSGYAGLLVLVIAGMAGSKKTMFATMPLIAIAAVVLMIPDNPVFDRLAYTFGGSNGGALDDSTNLRIFLWKSAIDRFIDNPVFGIGLGRSILPPDDPLSSEILYAHNYYLTQLVQLGVTGFTITILMFLSFIRAALQAEPELRRFSLALIGMLAVVSFTGEPLYSSAVYIFYVTSVALVSQTSNTARISQQK